jgi:hypothetical protein
VRISIMAGGSSSRPDTLTQTDQQPVSKTPLQTGRAIRFNAETSAWRPRAGTTDHAPRQPARGKRCAGEAADERLRLDVRAQDTQGSSTKKRRFELWGGRKAMRYYKASVEQMGARYRIDPGRGKGGCYFRLSQSFPR